MALSSSEVHGPVTLTGAQILGSLSFELCGLGALLVDGRLAWHGTSPTLAILLPSKIRNRVDIRACNIRGEVRFGAALIEERYAGRYAVEITSSTLGQSLSFWDEGLAEARSNDSIAGRLDEQARAPGQRAHWRFAAFEPGALDGGWPIILVDLPEPEPEPSIAAPLAEADEISTAELLANLSSRHVFTDVRGDIRVALCKIGGDACLTNLRARGRKVVFESVDIQGDLLAEWNGRRYRASSKPEEMEYATLLNARAATIELWSTTIKGEARLTGLHLSGAGGGDRAQSNRAGESRPALAVKYSRVEGMLALSETDPAWARFHESASRAVLDGDLDLSWSSIDHLVLDGQSLGVRPPIDRREGGTRFNRLIAGSSIIRELELKDPPPGQVDLADARVTVWDFGQVEGKELRNKFRVVLESQEPFKRNVYQEVEGYLYNAGFEDLAKDIRKDLVRRQHHDTLQRLRKAPGAPGPLAVFEVFFKRLASEINRLFTGNFTSEWRPIAWWLFVSAAAILFFLDPARVQVATVHRRSVAERPQAFCATLNGWGITDAAKFTTRFILPVVTAVGFDELDAADEVQTHSVCRATAERIQTARFTTGLDWFRPSTFATVVRVLCWLFLSLATGTIFAKMSRTPRRGT